MKREPATLATAQSFASMLESNDLLKDDDILDLKTMISEVKQAIADNKVKSEIEAISAIQRGYTMVDGPPVDYQDYQDDQGSHNYMINGIDPNTQVLGAKPVPRPPGQYPVSPYGNPIRQPYTSQQMYAPRFKEGYVPRQTYQNRPFGAPRPAYGFNQAPRPPRPYRPAGPPMSLPSGPPVPRQPGPQQQRAASPQTNNSPFCRRCNCAHEFGQHLVPPSQYCSWHQSNSHSDANCFHQNQQSQYQNSQQEQAMSGNLN
jgi:hypothetical protein